MKRKVFTVLALLFLLSVPALGKDNDRYRRRMMNDGSMSPESEQKPLAPGLWGGQHISLEITEAGAALEFDCAHGTIEGKILPGKGGKILLKGTYVQERPGPTRQSDEGKSEPIELSGTLKGNNLTLTIRRPGSKQAIGTFTLVRGKEPFIVKCR